MMADRSPKESTRILRLPRRMNLEAVRPSLRASRKAPRSMTVVISTHNRRDELLRTLDSLSRAVPSTVEIVVVSAASDDGTDDEVPKKYPRVRLVAAPDIGWGEANNVGYQFASGDFLAFMGPDMVFDPGFLDTVLLGGELPPNLGSLGTALSRCPRSEGGPAGFQYLGYSVWHRLLVRHRFTSPSELAMLRARNRRFVTVGCAPYPIVPRDVFERVGGFDPTYFYSGDEIDLAIRISQLGFENYADPSHLVYTDLTATGTPKTEYYWTRSRFIRALKFCALPELVAILPPLLAEALGRCFLWAVRGDSDRSRAVLRALIWCARNFRSIPRLGGRSFLSNTR